MRKVQTAAIVSGNKIPHSFAIFFLKVSPDSFLESFREGHRGPFEKTRRRLPHLSSSKISLRKI
jgi:hypothetical protein